MNGQNFIELLHRAFEPFLKDLGFIMESPLISGRYYLTNFKNPKHVVSVSFEPGDEALFIMIFSVINGALSDIDDCKQTPRLGDLNKMFINTVTQSERLANNAYFQSIKANDKEEEKLLKAAKELRLVLPKYLSK